MLSPWVVWKLLRFKSIFNIILYANIEFSIILYAKNTKWNEDTFLQEKQKAMFMNKKKIMWYRREGKEGGREKGSEGGRKLES